MTASVVTGIAIAAFVVAGAAATVRAVRGPSLADRVAAFDVALISLMGGTVTWAVRTGDNIALDLLVVIAIVGFTATAATSRYIERQGRRE